MTSDTPVEFTVYPDDCDAFGHLHQASFLVLFERARWDALVRGPGMDVFTRHDVWPAVRKTIIEYHRQALPGDRLQFDIELVTSGRTSFQMRQTARAAGDGGIVATTDSVFVCVGKDDRPAPVPPEVARYFTARPSRGTGVAQHLNVSDLAMTVEVNGDGPAVLMVHGFPLDRTMWKSVSSTLTGWRRIIPDLRGCGLTEVPESGYSIATYADDMVALLDTLHVDRAVVCGHSMGGYIAFDLLERYPDRVRGLILVSTRATADDADGKARRDAMITRVRRDGTGFLAKEMTEKLLAPTSLQTMPDVVTQVRGVIANSQPDGVVGALSAMRDRNDVRSTLANIAVPTLVVAGSDDQLIPLPVTKFMADAIPDAHFSVIPAAGHMAPTEQPVNTSRVIKEFLEALS